MNPHVAAAISRIPETAWTAIRYPDAFVDPDTGELVSDAEVAEIEYTAFTSRKKAEHVTARLIVRRVRRLSTEVAAEQGELFAAWRYHPVFTDSPFEMLQAEHQHRQHAVIEQVIAKGKGSALAHLPSGSFQANAAWLTLWTITHNLLRAAGALAGTFHAKAMTATIRSHLGQDHRYGLRAVGADPWCDGPDQHEGGALHAQDRCERPTTSCGSMPGTRCKWSARTTATSHR